MDSGIEAHNNVAEKEQKIIHGHGELKEANAGIFPANGNGKHVLVEEEEQSEVGKVEEKSESEGRGGERLDMLDLISYVDGSESIEVAHAEGEGGGGGEEEEDDDNEEEEVITARVNTLDSRSSSTLNFKETTAEEEAIIIQYQRMMNSLSRSMSREVRL